MEENQETCPACKSNLKDEKLWEMKHTCGKVINMEAYRRKKFYKAILSGSKSF